MRVTEMNKEDFARIPAWSGEAHEFDSVVIIPTSKMHSSGYRMMDFVFCNKQQEPICRVSRGSDALHIDGIGGYGYTGYSETRPVEAWRIDCLPCRYLRLFSRGTITPGGGCSDFEIFWNEPK